MINMKGPIEISPISEKEKDGEYFGVPSDQGHPWVPTKWLPKYRGTGISWSSTA
jgi:hypothetical protein